MDQQIKQRNWRRIAVQQLLLFFTKKHSALIPGRAVGAYFAKGDILLLFIDGDFLIPMDSDLLPFVQSVQNGTDLAF